MYLNLAPYNTYILYAALVLLLIFLIVTGVKAGKLLKAVKAVQPQAESIKTNVQLAKIKVDVMQEKKKEDAAKNKKYSILIPILLAIKHTYDADENLNGPKGMAKAANQVIRKRSEQKKLFEQWMR